jgi:hypothetical protein
MYNRDPLFATLDHKGYCKQEFLNKLYDNKKCLGFWNEYKKTSNRVPLPVML